MSKRDGLDEHTSHISPIMLEDPGLEHDQLVTLDEPM
jgi:hypothetical protein